MTERQTIHLYDLDHYDSERIYRYPYLIYFVGWSAQEMNKALTEKCFRLGIKEVWTFENITERSPRFREWKINTDSLSKGECWIPPSEFLLSGWRPDIHFHFVYQIKKRKNISANDVYVSSDCIEERKSLTALGVHLT